jgi:RsmE family RNA methyltransferase
VVRWEGDRALKHTERLRIVSREAAMQSRRLFLPTVEAPASFVALAGVEGVFRADGNGDHPMSNMTTILVGPEGGWTDTEREIVPHSVRLSDAVLRSETAAVAAGALFTAFRSGLTQPARGQ